MPMSDEAAVTVRRNSVPVQVGAVTVGGQAPVVVQSMTNTDTADVMATVVQVAELARAGSELVRITVNTEAAAEAVPRIRERLGVLGVQVPLVGDFHYNGHKLLERFPDCARRAGQVSHQPRQCRPGAQEGRAVRDHRGTGLSP